MGYCFEEAVWIQNAAAAPLLNVICGSFMDRYFYIKSLHVIVLLGQEDGKSASAGGRTIGNVTVIPCLLDLFFLTSFSGHPFLDIFFWTSFSGHLFLTSLDGDWDLLFCR